MNNNPSRAPDSRFRSRARPSLETNDLDEYSGAIGLADVRFVAHARPAHVWGLSQADMGEGALYVGQMGAPTTGFGAVRGGFICIGFRLGGAGRWVVNGREVDPASIVVRSGNPEFCVRLDPDVEWVMAYVSEERFLRRYRALTGGDEDRRSGIRVRACTPETLSRLSRLVRCSLSSSQTLPEGVWSESRLDDLITDELVSACRAPARAERPEYRGLIARCNQFLEARKDVVLTCGDLCEALQVNERTLRRFFKAAYGQAPARFLRLRRLAAARRALAGGPPEHNAITRVATALGFCELGRFAADYRAAMGEYPSETLRRARAGRLELSGNA